jgi:GT2 family glycosyltransferase
MADDEFMHDYSVTFATLNCLDYTRKCVDSLLRAGCRPDQIVAVDNGSTDGSAHYLQNNSGVGHVILNKQNLSCGAAWNQGILARQSEWTIVMNNDLVVSQNFAERLIDAAIANDFQLISPALVDGELDYDFELFDVESSRKMGGVLRLFSSHAVCMCIHWSVFMKIGFFRVNPNLLGFEDALFFHDIRSHGVRHGTTGSVWLHHFGSVTQEHMKLERGIPQENVLVKVNDRELLNQTWFERKLTRLQLKKVERTNRLKELQEFGVTLHGLRRNHEFEWL